MSKATYIVKVINKGREKDYDDFWTHHKRVNEAGEALHSALVGFTVDVEAKNKAEAIRLVRDKYPGLRIDEPATERLG